LTRPERLTLAQAGWSPPRLRSGRGGRGASAALAPGVAFLLLTAVGLSACAQLPPTPGAAPDAAAALVAATPNDYHLDLVTDVPPPSVARLMVGRSDPLATTVGVYRSTVDPPRTITATLATFGEPIGASALYNRWFADNAFMAAADRHALALADQAECFDVGWPAFHAAIAHRGTLFVLVEAETTVGVEQWRALVTPLIEMRPPS
jgi:hypothetical protein